MVIIMESGEEGPTEERIINREDPKGATSWMSIWFPGEFCDCLSG